MFPFEWRFEYADEICGRSRGDRVYGQGREVIAAKDRSSRHPRRVGVFDLFDERGTAYVSERPDSCMQAFAFSAAGDGEEQSLRHFAWVRFISYRLLANLVYNQSVNC